MQVHKFNPKKEKKKMTKLTIQGPLRCYFYILLLLRPIALRKSDK